MKNKFLECGRVCGAHGVRGVLRVEPWCDSPRDLATKKRVFISEGELGYVEHKILTASVNGGNVLLSLEGISTREDAIAMRGTVLYLSREDIRLPRGAMLLADMIGLPVVDADTGREYGRIREITDGVQGHLYTVQTENGDVILPSVGDFIKGIEPDKCMLVRVIPGFFD